MGREYLLRLVDRLDAEFKRHEEALPNATYYKPCYVKLDWLTQTIREVIDEVDAEQAAIQESLDNDADDGYGSPPDE